MGETKFFNKNSELNFTWEKIKKANLNNGGYVLDVMHSAFHFLDGQNALQKSIAADLLITVLLLWDHSNLD